MNAKTGLLLVGHGTRSEVGMAQFLALVQRIQSRAGGQLVVEPAFLELQQPDIGTAVGTLVDRGIERLVTMPLLLFAAGHAKEDVPHAVAAALARRSRGDIQQVQAGHLGCHPAMVELSRQRMGDAERQAGAGGQGTEDRRTCLLLVGRGSRDESATAEMYEFALLQQDAARREPRPPNSSPPPDKTEVAFLAMARPLLQEKLPEIAGQGYKRVIVQPHLLFHGELVEAIQRQVSEAEGHFPETEWIMAEPLADLPSSVTQATKLIEKVILDRCLEVGIHVVVSGADD